MPLAATRTAASNRARGRGSRSSRGGGFSLDDLVSLLTHWAPPGGWLSAGLILLSIAALIGVLLPESPAGLAVQWSVGSGGFLIAAWSAALAWLRLTHRAMPWARLSATLVLSATWLLALALREPGGGGTLGEQLLQALDSALGRTVGLALISIAAAVSVVILIGIERIVHGLAVLGSVVRGIGESRQPRPGLGLPQRFRSSISLPRATPTLEPVILGPRSSSEPASKPHPVARDRPPRAANDQTPWKRPDPTVLGAATDGGAFSPAELKARARIIEETLLSFGIEARVVEVQQGPAITQFGVDPAPGVAVNRIVQRQNDLALRLGAPTLRVLAPVPGRTMVGLEVPNTSVATVKLGDLTGAPQFTRARLPIGIGMDVSGKPIVGDLAKMPHLLAAGATGSGKSVFINSLITSLLISRTPDEVQFVLIDPKQVEMSQYKGLPHLRLPVVTDMDKVVAALRWTVLEMERRYNRFSEVGARNIVAFNERFPDERLGYLVIVIDELADMMMSAPEDVERQICRLAQLGRAAGVHLVVATQRPSVDVITGLIKANLPTRIAFAVSSGTDSRVILDRVGAERLLGRGDALYQAGDEMNPRRVQGSYTSDDEIEAICNHWRAQGDAQHTADDEAELEHLARQEDPEEKLLAQAREIIADHGDVSPGFLARKLKIGAQKAARIHQTLVADEAAARSSVADD